MRRADSRPLPPVAVMGTHDYTTVVSSALRDHFGDARSAVKEIAAIANCNERTAENWYCGKNAPGGLHLMRLACAVPALQAHMLRMMGMEDVLDPDFMAEFCAFRDMIARSAARVREQGSGNRDQQDGGGS